MTRPTDPNLGAMVAVALIAACGVWYFANAKSGIYNNANDDAVALAEHEADWARRFAGTQPDRLHVAALVGHRGGECVTGEAQWERVPLDRRIDARLIEGQVPIECHVFVRGRWPADFPGGFVWSSVFVATGPDRLQLVTTSRQRLPH